MNIAAIHYNYTEQIIFLCSARLLKSNLEIKVPVLTKSFFRQNCGTVLSDIDKLGPPTKLVPGFYSFDGVSCEVFLGFFRQNLYGTSFDEKN